MSLNEKPLIWLQSEVKTPPFSREARLEAGFLLRKLQQGEKLSMPLARPMPAIGKYCYELRLIDENKTWRIIYKIDFDVIIILDIFAKKTSKTPKNVIDVCHKRIKNYESIPEE